MNLTSKQKGIQTRQNILNCIIRFIQDNGYSPTVREICELTNLESTSTVYSHLQRLQSEGFITMQEYQPRTIRVIGYKFVKE